MSEQSKIETERRAFERYDLQLPVNINISKYKMEVRRVENRAGFGHGIKFMNYKFVRVGI